MAQNPQPPYPPQQPQPVQPAQPLPVQPQPGQPIPVAAVPQAPAQPIPQPAGQPQPLPISQLLPAQPVQQVPQPVAHQAAQPIAHQPAQPVPVAPASPRPITAVPGQGHPSHAQPAQTQPIPVQPAQAVPAQPQQRKRATGAARPVPVTPGAAQAAPAAQPVPAQPKSARPKQPQPASNRPAPAAAPIPVSTDPSDVTVDEEATDGEEEENQAAQIAMKSAPPWLVSMVIHMGFLIAAALFILANSKDKQVELEILPVFAEDLGEQLEEDELQMADLEMPEITEPMIAEDMTQVEDPFAAPPELDLSVDEAIDASSDIKAPSIGLALSGREKGAKEALLAAYGGTAKTEDAVKLGLEWLIRQQNRSTGMWSLEGPYKNGGGIENKVAATAMAMLALQGAGHTHKTGKHSRAVARGAAALLKLQDADGNFFQQGPHNHRLYTQAQATIAICELYGMTKDEKFRKPAQKALDYAMRAQSQELGGWRYIPRQDSDTSVTGWFVMALQSGKMAGLEVQSPTLDNITKFLDSTSYITVQPGDKDRMKEYFENGTIDPGVFYSYKIGEIPSLTMTAEGLLCRQYLGWKHDDPRLAKGAAVLNANPVDYVDQNLYYWYYATQMTHHMGGKIWDKWNKVMRESVPAAQEKDGPEKGSWDPEDDRWGHHGGRLYATCLSIFMLEVYYRHLPIYKH